ncbi:MAG: hypothetical protein ABSG74_14225 [Candidatus Bathyarchaeia archaeon]
MAFTPGRKPLSATVKNRKEAMRLKTLQAALLAGALGLAVQAQASVVFDLTYSDPSGNAANGQLTANPNDDGSYTAISGTLDITASTTAGVVGSYSLYFNPNGTAPTVSPAGAFIYDNQLFPGKDPYLTTYGLLLWTSGVREINLWGNSPGNYSLYAYDNGVGYTLTYTGPATVTLVPEPTTMVAGIGALGLVLLGMFRSKRSGVIRIGQ